MITILFISCKFTDATIVCEGAEIQCQRAILAGGSTVFDVMSTHNMREMQESKVNIKDIDAETCQIIIIFIYNSGNVDCSLGTT